MYYSVSDVNPVGRVAEALLDELSVANTESGFPKMDIACFDDARAASFIHDIRSPLCIIKGFYYVLSRTGKYNGTEDVLGAVKVSSDRLEEAAQEGAHKTIIGKRLRELYDATQNFLYYQIRDPYNHGKADAQTVDMARSVLRSSELLRVYMAPRLLSLGHLIYVAKMGSDDVVFRREGNFGLRVPNSARVPIGNVFTNAAKYADGFVDLKIRPDGKYHRIDLKNPIDETKKGNTGMGIKITESYMEAIGGKFYEGPINGTYSATLLLPKDIVRK